MPLYEYYCSECQESFELLRTIDQADRNPACSACGSERTARTISLTAPVAIGKDSPDLAIGGCACGGSCRCAA